MYIQEVAHMLYMYIILFLSRTPDLSVVLSLERVLLRATIFVSCGLPAKWPKALTVVISSELPRSLSYYPRAIM